MEHQDEIYQSHAEGYDRLIQREDFRGNLLPALEAIVPLRGKIVVDLGTGTGRFPCLLAGIDAQVLGLDRSLAMLRVARAKLALLPQPAGRLAVGDNVALPVRSGLAEIVLAGWTFGHATVWSQARWRQEVAPALREAFRVLRTGGTAIVCETLGTGSPEPAPPTPALADYYRYLEQEWGFRRRVVATDYRFASVDEAVSTLRFFFGEEMGDLVRSNHWTVVPEWTGIWWRHA